MLLCLALSGCATVGPGPAAPSPAASAGPTAAATSTQSSAANAANAANASNASTASTGPAAHADDAADRWKQRPSVARCRTALDTLARGDLAAYPGLGSCGRIDAETALGSSGDQPSRFEQFGEYRVYSHAGNSILVWFLGDDIRVIQLLYPKLSQPIATLLGPPNAKAPSQLSRAWEQWIYADRGLAAHVKRGTGEVVALFAFQPTSVAAFLATDIARVSKSEAPLEELK